ncbi:hypothetical protein [Nocardia sp. NPDC051981]
MPTTVDRVSGIDTGRVAPHAAPVTFFFLTAIPTAAVITAAAPSSDAR